MFVKLKQTIPYALKAPTVPKMAAEDITLTVSNAGGGKTTFPVAAGTGVIIHVLGLHYNRKRSYFILATGSDRI